MGWLHSRPKFHDKEESKTRLERLQDGDPLLDMPEADSFLLSVWFDLGKCLSGGYGLTPLTYQEIKAYSDSVIKLTPFECKTLIAMSRIYVSEQSAATSDIHRKAPHEGEASLESMRSNVVKAFKSMIRKSSKK